MQTLVDGIPGSVGSDWAALVSYGADEQVEQVLATSPGSPPPEDITLDVPLRLTTIAEPYAGTALIPLGGTRLGLMVVRESGPAYHPAELWRLEQVGAVAGHVVSQSRAATTGLAATTDLEVVS